MTLTTDAAARKAIPLTTGVLDYFPLAIAAVAECSKKGNDQHNPGQPLHWAREKSTDHADCIGRHLIERGTIDTDGIRHAAKLAWRALALLQTEIEDSDRASHRAAVDAGYASLQGYVEKYTPKPINPIKLAEATAERLRHNADPTTRHGGLPKMQEQKYYFGVPFTART